MKRSSPDLQARRLQTGILLDLVRLRGASERFAEAQLAELGLERITPAQANTLMVLFEARRPLTAAEVARRLGLSEVTVGRFVRALEEGEWVGRRRDPEDGRRLLLETTPKAREALPRFIAASNALLDRVFDGVERETIEGLSRLLGEVMERLESSGR